MPNDIANNMADTIHQLEEDRIMLSTRLTDLQFAYNEQMLKLKEAKRLLKAAVDDMSKEADCGICLHDDDGGCPIEVAACKFKWRYADEALKLLNGEK